jgi:hypothetical protein
MQKRGQPISPKRVRREMLISLCKQALQISGKTIGEYKGFKMSINVDSFFKTEPYVEFKGELTHRVDMGSDVFGNLTRIDNMVNNLPNMLEGKRHDFDSVNTQLMNAKKEVLKPFEQEFELRQKLVRLNELNHELSMDKKDEAVDIADNEPSENEKAVAMER